MALRTGCIPTIPAQMRHGLLDSCMQACVQRFAGRSIVTTLMTQLEQLNQGCSGGRQLPILPQDRSNPLQLDAKTACGAAGARTLLPSGSGR